MALPVILVDSATGSDTLASGAGPTSALTGTSASTDGTGTVVTLDGSPDLTNVATDGSHVIYLADATAGARNFGKITNKDNVAKTVTVANAFGLSLSGKSWAIGGKRASIGGTNSAKLFSNNSAAGDAMPGWVVEMQSGHTETIAAQFNMRRAGDTTDGRIVLRGASGAATMPIVTFSNNGAGFNWVNILIELMDFEIQNSNATKTASVAMQTASLMSFATRIKVSNSTNKFWKAFTSSSSAQLKGCYFANTASDAVSFTGASPNQIEDCTIVDSGGHGILTSSTGVPQIVRCVIARCAGDGIRYGSTLTTNQVSGAWISDCVIYNNTSDGIEISGASTALGCFGGMRIENNIIAKNGAYGINYSGASVTAALLTAQDTAIRNNCFGSGSTANTSGTVTPSGIDSGSQSVDPLFVNAASDDYRIGMNIRRLGYPIANAAGLSIRSYADIGMFQRGEGASIKAQVFGIGGMVGT